MYFQKTAPKMQMFIVYWQRLFKPLYRNTNQNILAFNKKREPTVWQLFHYQRAATRILSCEIWHATNKPEQETLNSLQLLKESRHITQLTMGRSDSRIQPFHESLPFHGNITMRYLTFQTKHNNRPQRLFYC